MRVAPAEKMLPAQHWYDARDQKTFLRFDSGMLQVRTTGTGKDSTEMPLRLAGFEETTQKAWLLSGMHMQPDILVPIDTQSTDSRAINGLESHWVAAETHMLAPGFCL